MSLFVPLLEFNQIFVVEKLRLILDSMNDMKIMVIIEREGVKPSSPTSRRAPSGPNAPQGVGPFFYAIVSLITFLIGLTILTEMLWNAPLLLALGLTGNYYYVALVVFGLAAAVSLFGVLQSKSSAVFLAAGGRLTLGGAIVALALVVVGNFLLVPNPSPFAVTVFVHGQGGSHDFVPKNSAAVLMELGPEVRKQQVGPDGAVYFTNLAPSYRGQEVALWIESEQFESVHPEQKYPLKGDALHVEVRKKRGANSATWLETNPS